MLTDEGCCFGRGFGQFLPARYQSIHVKAVGFFFSFAKTSSSELFGMGTLSDLLTVPDRPARARF